MPRDEREPAVGGRPVMVGERRQEQLGDVGCAGAGGRRDERARAEVRRQEEHRRRAGAVEVERVGRRASRKIVCRARRPPRGGCAPSRPARDVVDRRRRRGGLEQRPDRGEHGRLAARRLADERAHRAAARTRARGPRDSPGSRCASAAASRSRCPERSEIDGRVAGLPAPQEALDRRMEHDVVELGARRTAGGRAPRRPATSPPRASGRRDRRRR